MDSMWSYRSAYAEALQIKTAQDQYCTRAEEGLWDLLEGPFPDDPRWEMLVDVLRGKVKVNSTATFRVFSAYESLMAYRYLLIVTKLWI